MTHSYTNILIHCVFSTKNRERIISPDLSRQLTMIFNEIAEKNKFKILAFGGMEDHLHLLLSLPPSLATADAVRLLKGSSSKWIHDNLAKHPNFRWQQGYSAFSVSISHVKRTIAYINNQREHHQKRTFMEECALFLKKHGIESSNNFKD